MYSKMVCNQSIHHASFPYSIIYVTLWSYT
nr:MAG TPA: hypothetical protein [Bacteriophage sp.]